MKNSNAFSLDMIDKAIFFYILTQHFFLVREWLFNTGRGGEGKGVRKIWVVVICLDEEVSELFRTLKEELMFSMPHLQTF